MIFFNQEWRKRFGDKIYFKQVFSTHSGVDFSSNFFPHTYSINIRFEVYEIKCVGYKQIIRTFT